MHAACGGQSGEEPAILSLCEEVSSTDVSAEDGTLGFSANEVLDLLDGRAWDLSWRDDQAEWYAGSSLHTLTVHASAGEGSPRVVELADVAGESCPMAGTLLVFSAVLALADGDSTFATSGSVSLAASGLQDDRVSLEYDAATLPVSELPEDLVTAAENAVAFAGELGDTSVQLGQTFAELELFLEAETTEGNTVAAVAAATLFPTTE